MKKDCYKKINRPFVIFVITLVSWLLLCLLIAGSTHSQSSHENSDGGAAEMARKLQKPLGNIKAIMTNNAIGFNTGDDNGTSYGFQIQPVYAIDFPDWGFTFLPRAIIPILGLEPGTDDCPPIKINI